VDANSVCVGCNVTFTVITDPCGHEDDVEWSAPGGDPNSGTGETFTTSWDTAGIHTATASLCDSNDSNDVTVVEVASLEPNDPNVTYAELDDGDGDPNTRSFTVCIVDPNHDPNVITVVATPNPDVNEPNLPACWTLTGGDGTGKLLRTVDRTTTGVTTISCECNPSSKTTKIYVVKPEIVSVDANDPNNTKVNYRTNPIDGVIPLVDFNAPGTTDSKSNVSGDFYFTYDQNDVDWGVNTIHLECGCGSYAVDCNVTKTNKMPDDTEVLSVYFLVEGVGLRLYNHKLRESYNSYVYSIPYSGKTIHTGASTVLIDFGADYNNICGWTEDHKYSWTGGGTSWVTMVVGSGWLPPNTASRVCNTVMWCVPTGLTGIGKCTGLLWDYGGGSTPGVITNAEVDRTMLE